MFVIQYICNVFFIVLDLRLTRLGYGGIPFFLPWPLCREKCVPFWRQICSHAIFMTCVFLCFSVFEWCRTCRFFWRFPGHEKTHMAYRKKYKPYILKYKALISKYMPYIFRLFKHLNHKDLQKGQKWRQKHERQRGVLERLLTVFCYAGRGVFCVRGAGILRGRAENKSGDTMTFKLHDISLFEQDT